MSEQPSAPTRSKAKKKAKSADKAGKKAAKAAVAPPEPRSPEPTPPLQAKANGGPPPAFEAPGLNGEQREIIEKMSANLARAALTAQGAIAEAALRQAERPAALSPDPFHVAPALSDVMGKLAAQPDKMVRAQADLFKRYLELWQ